MRNELEGVDRLPSPMDPTLTIKTLLKVLKSLIEQDLFLPGSKALLLKTAGDAKPLFFNGFLLAPDPQKMPDAIDRLPVRHQPMTWH